ncbi:MAG: methionyl-tRNA formyltransferase [Candidatus Marinimicrobia bacterium]|nr:methionyl-tRNA formyltransferase [Candidatus Neomarinimicrobiota bacterium]
MKIVFMGNPEFALPSLLAINKSRHKIVAVVTNLDKPKGRGLKLQKTPVKKLAEDLGLPILQPDSLESEVFLNQIRSFNADIFVVVAFKILPESLLEIPPMGAINLHASLLPKYRGAAPINWALINGEKKTGITIFKIRKKVDTGEILYQKSVEINEDDTAGVLSQKLANLGGESLVKVLDLLEEGKIDPIPQDNSKATYAPKITTEVGKINWKLDAKKIKNLIHGLSPDPGAYSYIFKKRVKFLKAGYEELDTSYLPGTIVYIDKKQLKIQTGKGLLVPKVLQMEGKKPLDVAFFIKGFRGKIGDRFIS